MVNQQASPEQPVANTTDLALVRTALAQDRTLMAWIRTSFSMITFGFTIMKTFEYLKDSRPGPRNLGVTLIMLGTGCMIAATLQHWNSLKRAKHSDQPGPFPLALIVAVLISALGLLALLGAFVRTGIF